MIVIRRRTAAAATAGLVLAGVAGCATTDPKSAGSPAAGGSAASTGATSASPAASSATPVATPSATVSTPAGLDAMLPSDALVVKVTDGTLKDVQVVDAKGKPVAGKLTADGWKSTRNLLPQADYTATLTLAASDGSTTTKTQKFSTLQTNIAGFDILYDGYNAGIGLPVSIQFVSQVETKAMRAEVEKHVSVSVTPAQEGSWGWLDNRQLMWRPKTYWKPGTKISITANLAGIQTGANKWVGKDQTGGFTIGDARIIYVDIANHSMRVTKNGTTVNTFPVTTGRQPEFTTRSGIKVIMERLDSVVMDSTTVDIPKNSPDAYRLKVSWAMRLTWSGEFIHAAPWSVGSQGYANVSHGCTGMSTSNAKWLFDFSRVGDVAIYTGSNRSMTVDNGIGIWNYTYNQWKAQSALV